MSEPPEDSVQDQLDLEAVKHRSVTGVVTITARTFALQIVAFIATFLLTVLLSPQDYGTFFVVSAVVNFLVYFSDIGLAAALIQKKDDLTDDDLSTTFTIQQILVVSIVIIAMFFSQPVANFYHFSQAGTWLFRSLVISLFLSSLKTIPSIKLERRLEFGKLIIPQIAENLIFYGVAVYLAWQGQGITSFTYAVLARSTVGLIIMYLLAPWWPKISINRPAAKSLLKFGVPFQLNSFLALIKDDFLTAFLGILLPLTQIGYLGWAQKWALFPLRMFMDSINKVTFPAYARLQHHPEALKKAIEKSLFFVSLCIFPLIIGLVVTGPAFVRLIPKYQKWEPALFALILFSVNSLWASVSTTITNTFAAVGKISINLKLMVMWTALTWIATPLLVLKIGYNGAALASAVVATSSIVPMIIIKRLFPVDIVSNIVPNLLSAVAMGGFTWLLTAQIDNLASLFFAICVSGILYMGLMITFQRRKITQELGSIYATLRRNL